MEFEPIETPSPEWDAIQDLEYVADIYGASALEKPYEVCLVELKAAQHFRDDVLEKVVTYFTTKLNIPSPIDLLRLCGPRYELVGKLAQSCPPTAPEEGWLSQIEENLEQIGFYQRELDRIMPDLILGKEGTWFVMLVSLRDSIVATAQELNDSVHQFYEDFERIPFILPKGESN